MFFGTGSIECPLSFNSIRRHCAPEAGLRGHTTLARARTHTHILYFYSVRLEIPKNRAVHVTLENERFREADAFCKGEGRSGEKGERKTEETSKGVHWISGSEKAERAAKGQQKQRSFQEKSGIIFR